MSVKGEKRNFICVWKDLKPSPDNIEQILADHEVWLNKEYPARDYWREPETDPPHDLSGADLSEAILQGANLMGALLKGADLTDARLEKAKLNMARLQGATLTGAHLENAQLFRAHLEEAKLIKTHLEGANLFWAHLEGAELIGASMEGAKLIAAHLEKTYLGSTSLEGADISKAHMEGANLIKANLSNANVAEVIYDRKMKCRGIRADTCYGSPRFKRHVQDLDFLEELKGPKLPWKKWRTRGFWRTPGFWRRRLIYLAWSIMSDCGRSISLWAAWSLFFAVAFGCLYAHPEGWSFLPESWQPHVTLGDCDQLSQTGRQATGFTPYYFSIVTFTTLGFGDVTACNLAGEIWVTLEVILGYIMLGGLISILANKLARRS